MSSLRKNKKKVEVLEPP